MGKRKFSDKEESSKKRKEKKPAEEPENDNVESTQPQNEVEDQRTEPGYSTDEFDIKHFRKELAAKQGQTMALTQFLQVCLNPDSRVDYLLQYLKTGGNSHEILRQIGTESKKNLTLATPAFHLFNLIILKVQSSLPHMIAITEEACRYFLNTFMPTLEIMISENSGPRHRKVVLKLLTSMVTLNPDLGVEVLNQAPLTPKHLHYIVEKANYKEKDNVRTSFVHFMTSFLVDGHLPLIKALLEKQGLLALVIPGLIQDEAEAVLMFLNILKKNVVENTLISKSLKLKTFSHQCLHNIFKIFSWKGPPELSHEVRNQLHPDISKLLSDILVTLFTSHRVGLYFLDNSLGTADANKNQNLYKALLSLKRPWENDYECATLLEIIYKCPDLHRAIINVVEQCFEPQHSPIWERATAFVIKLLDKLKPEDMIPRMTNINSVQAANFVRFITVPIPLLKFIQANLGKDITISLYCVKVLVKMLHTLKRYIQILEMEDKHVAEIRNKLEYFFPKHLPTPAVIVSLIHNVINGNQKTEQVSQDYKLPKPDSTESLISLLDLLLLYNSIQPAYFETLENNIDMKKILDFSMTLEKGHVALLKFKIVSLWLMLDESAISFKNPMFKELFLIMLEVYTSNDDDTWMEAKDTLYVFFKNTAIFEGDEDEIHLIMYALRNSKVSPISLVGDIVEYVLINSKDLTEYVRNQIVHFEITDETSESSLEKLLNDLMEGQSTEDNVFLESKMPSPFIVGCMQYTQSNKDAKKNLKHFLSLYVACLLHSNYSPELTEVLIGDSKLETRSYVASWIGKPVALPDAVIGQDDVLKRISKSIIDNEDISFHDVFQYYLEETSQELCDIVIKDIPYKVVLSKTIDSSELLVWSKYLIYCIVRLMNLERLTEVQMNKIKDYLDCIIAIGRKNHMLDVCRNIIMTLFKNPHFLKIYRPLSENNDKAYILATEFILQIIIQYEDIVSFLNNKHNVLKMFQQKNKNEILKAFIKVNKNKNFNSPHTMRVLEVVGLANEDDSLVFQRIFNSDISTCINESKEPSIILELLRVLIEKYSKSITLDLSFNIIKKTMKLYTDLLTNTDFVPNLTNLENALVRYFENKPQYVLQGADEIFKKFFNANTIRKSTSNLAAVLLKLNVKFCNVFKEQLIRPEILGQRELTLPLGEALLNHNQFLPANKELLMTIYNEYKSNIQKMLDKPHKAGQIYVSCWRFVRKLLIECMDLKDSEDYFSKSRKFEIIEPSHIQLIQSVFLRLCLFYEGCKKEYLINYYLSMLQLITIALKEGKDTCVVNEIISNVYNVTEISTIIKEFGTEEKEDFKKVTESSVWQSFCKAILKDSLKVKTVDQGSTCGPQMFCLLTTLVKLFYPENHDDIVTLFEMVTSHSEFLNVMLSHHSSDIKSRLIEFLYVLILRNKSVMKTQQIPVYLSAYHATRSPCDRLILSILHFYESNGQPVNEYKPYVWGDSAANYYAVRKNRTSSLWGHPTPNQVFNLFEKDIIERTVRNFPVMQTLDYHYEGLPSNIYSDDDVNLDGSIRTVIDKITGDIKHSSVEDQETSVKRLILKAKYESAIERFQKVDLISTSHLESDDGIYDPVFLFPLLSHLLVPGSMASCFKMLRTGLLSVPVMALSSHCPKMRAAAYHVLHRFCMLLETETKHKNDKLFLSDFINTLRLSLSTAIVNSQREGNGDNHKNPRLPAVDALYLARGLMVSTVPLDPLYKPVNNFLIAKQFVDLTVVPDFLSLFHDSDVESAERRLWILDIIKDGTKTMTDVNVVFKTMCLKMIMDYYSCVLSDRKAQEKILDVVSALIAIPRAFDILLEGYALVSWLHAAVRMLRKDDRVLVKGILNMIKNMLYSMAVNSFSRNMANTKTKDRKEKTKDLIPEIKLNKDIENEIVNILYEMLPFVEIQEVEYVVLYIKVYRLLSKRAVKTMSRQQIVRLVTKCGFSVKDNEFISVLTKTLDTHNVALLNSKIIDTNEISSGSLSFELKGVVNTYLG